MEVKTKNFYTCKFCGKTSTLENKIIKCESSHIGIDLERPIEVTFKNGRPYPVHLTVSMVDGTVVEYIINFVKPKR